MKELAAIIQTALKWVPMHIKRVAAKCALRPTLFHPQIAIPRNTDSMKNAKTASIASGLPKTSPTKRE